MTTFPSTTQYITDKRLHKPVLVGFSFGAALAMWVACTKPDLIGPFIDLDGTPFDAGVDADHFNKDKTYYCLFTVLGCGERGALSTS